MIDRGINVTVLLKNFYIFMLSGAILIPDCCCSVTKSCLTLRTHGVSFTISRSLLKFMCVEWVMLSNHLILCQPLLLLLSIFASIRVFPNEFALFIRWPKYWGFSFSVSPTNTIQSWLPVGLTGLISLLSRELSRPFSSTTIWNHQFFGSQLSLWSNSHICTWLLEKP